MPGFNIKVEEKNICGPEEYKKSGIVIDEISEDKSRQIPNYKGAEHNREYSRRSRWLIEIQRKASSSAPQDSFIVYAYKCGRPAVEIEEVPIHHSQEEIYVPGKSKWQPIDFSFYERLKDVKSDDGRITDSSNETAKYFFTWWASDMLNLRRSRYNPDKLKYLLNVNINMLDGAGHIHHYYKLFHAWPTKVTPSELDYTDSNISEVSVTLRYSKALEGNYPNGGFY